MNDYDDAISKDDFWDYLENKQQKLEDYNIWYYYKFVHRY